jgi:sugar phosphate isomerase/epimerase
MPSQLALQTYTLRDYCKTPPDIARTMKRVREIGYEAVQISALGPIQPEELAKILRDQGLTACASHTGIDRLEKEPQAVLDEHETLGCRYTAVPGYFDRPFTAERWLAFVDRFNAVAAKFKGSPLQLGYHNHSHELIRYSEFGGATSLKMLIDRLDPSISFEIDTYWIQHGGGDPAAWIDLVRGRMPCVHLKDMVVTNPADPKPVMAEVGEGNLAWGAILSACRRAGCQWFIVEQDTCQRDPFESVAMSLRNLREMGL